MTVACRKSIWTLYYLKHHICDDGQCTKDDCSQNQAYLPGTGETLIVKEVLPGRGPSIALRLG